jgi:hypothetical protein
VVNTSPEPFSNVAVSTFEDLATTGLLYLAYSHPIVAGGVAAALLILAVALMVIAWRVLRRIYLKVQPEPGAPGMLEG